MAVSSVAESLAPYISFANLLGFAASIWLLMRVRGSALAPALGTGTWILVVGQGLHVLNDYPLAWIGMDVSDDAYDHLLIHVVLVAALVAFALGVGKMAMDARKA
ncbi:MAG: hypothetical protein QOE90_3738 [Thermoplasmata archaeon]|jgi:hypothetical protein|nr:hypothetical protein [Thermoplasmata archaeon]